LIFNYFAHKVTAKKRDNSKNCIISSKILNTKQLSTALSRYFKEKAKKFPKIFGDFKNSLYRCILVIKEISGLTGFDGEMKWYVSMRRLVGYLLNPSEQKINWRK